VNLPLLKRRDLLKLAGGAAILSAPALAQVRKPIVAFIFAVSPLSEMTGDNPISIPTRAFIAGLRKRGWIEGRNIVIERITLEGRYERAPAIFADLVARGVDVILPPNPLPVLQIAKDLVKTIPMVASLNSDPVVNGLVASLAQPGGNLTGITSVTGPELQYKRLQLLKELVPHASRIAYLGTGEHWDLFAASSSAADRPRIFALVDEPAQYDAAFAHIRSERADALYISGGAVSYNSAGRISAFAAELGLATTFERKESVVDGGLMSYGPSNFRVYDQMAGMVDRVLRGARPADLPVEQPTYFEMVLNLKTAKALGLTIPPLVLAQADEVIE
jgi:putative tryptophan/tyrosine transport system substrate-binding protein